MLLKTAYYLLQSLTDTIYLFFDPTTTTTTTTSIIATAANISNVCFSNSKYSSDLELMQETEDQSTADNNSQRRH